MFPQNTEALVAFLAKLRRNGKIASLGTALLSFQITELENRCASMRRRIEHKAKSRRQPSKRAA
jgi:hypothetical protein